MLNFDVAVPIPDDVPFVKYIEYIAGRSARARRIIKHVALAWSISLEDAEKKPRRMIVVLNSLLG